MGIPNTKACMGLLSPDDPDFVAILAVTYHSVDRWLRRWDAHRGDRPDRLGVVRVGRTYRSSTQAARQPAWTPSTEPPVVELVRPGDLTGLGITVGQYLRSWDDQRGAGDTPQLYVCFDSVTALLQYADVDTAIRFLHVFTGQLRTAETTSHFHLDPGALDNQTVDTLSYVFDTVIENTDGDGWNARS